MNELSDLLRDANKESWSSRAIALRAEGLGHAVGHATVNNYMAGRVPAKPSEDVLRALSAVFGIPLARLRKAAKLSTAITAIDLPPEASRLTRRQWAAVHEVIRSMVDPGEAESLGTVTELWPGGDSDVSGDETSLLGVAKGGVPEDSEPDPP